MDVNERTISQVQVAAACGSKDRDGLRLGLSMSLPFWNWQDGGISNQTVSCVRSTGGTDKTTKKTISTDYCTVNNYF